jgi:hypothetical protein
MMVSEGKEEKLFCGPFPSPKAFIHPVNKHMLGTQCFAALYQGLWRKGKVWEMKCRRSGNTAFLPPFLHCFDLHTAHPSMEPVSREQGRVERGTNFWLLNGFGCSCRPLPLRFPGSYLQGEALYS